MCQPNELKREIKKKVWGEANRGPTKNLGAMAHPFPALLKSPLNGRFCEPIKN